MNSIDRYEDDTIAAISTAVGAAGIGIVRVSGPAAVEVADRIFRAKSGRRLAEEKSGTLHYGFIEENGEILDEVLVSVLRAPHTYTRQDICEINCHGGVFLLQRVLGAVLRAGARLAEPGEFTRRAFLSGRIDLSQAEAVMDLISSENASASRNALSHLGGAMRKRISELKGRVLHETARIEAALDDPEHYDLTDYIPVLSDKIRSMREDLRILISRAAEGKIIREGVAAVILGQPNVGKSTLLNLLAGEERAIVTEIAGTTRDVLEEQVILGGVPLRVMDTAGLREDGDAVEKIGIERAKDAAEGADLILYVIDGSQPVSERDRRNLGELSGKKIILINNKADRPRGITDEELRSLLPEAPAVEMSAVNGTGLQTLAEKIRSLYFQGEVSADNELLVTSLRHQEALRQASEALRRVEESIRLRMPEDLYTVDLMDAYTALGRITGDEAGEDLINEIFSRFCMGK